MTRRLACRVAALLALALALGGCGYVKRPPGDQVGADATFTYAEPNEVVTDLDPSTSYSDEIVAMQNVYETLTRFDTATRTVQPLLARSWRSGDHGRTWTFRLRAGVRFHDGRPLRAADVKASIERTKRLKQGAAYEWDPVTSIATPGPLTVVFHLAYPAPLPLIASSAYAAYIFDVHAAPRGVNFVKWLQAGHDAGTGPYEISQYNAGQTVELRLRWFPRYWGGWSGPHYRQVVYEHIPEATTTAQLLEAGQITFAQQLTPPLFDQLRTAAGVSEQTTGSLENLLAMLNTASGPLRDLRVRRAVTDAIDYPGLIAILRGAAVPAHGFIPQGLTGFDPSLVNRQDLPAARRLLQAAGDGPGGRRLSLTMTYSSGDDQEALAATLMKSDLAQIGIDLRLRPLQYTTQASLGDSANVTQRQDIFLFDWYPDYSDAYSWFISLFHSANPPANNFSYLDDPTLDRQIDALPRAAAASRTAAQTAYAAAQRRVMRLAAVIPLYVTANQFAYRSTLRDFHYNPAYTDVVFVHDVRPLS